MKKKLIPFKLMPGSWGLKGKTRERAQAEYELEGYELETKLNELDYEGKEYKVKQLITDRKYNKIDGYDYEIQLANLEHDGKSLEIRMAEIDHAYRKLNDTEYEKKLATINEEGWVKILNVLPDSSKPNHGELELDWNDYFVEELREAGYQGASDEQIVDMWLGDLCRNIAMEQFSGVGDFDDRVGDGFINKSKADDGKWIIG